MRRKGAGGPIQMIVLVLGILGGLFHLGSALKAGFEERAAAEIASHLAGDSKRVFVSVRGEPVRASQGKFDRVLVGARDFAAAELPLFTEPDRPQTGELGHLRLDLRDFSLRGLQIARLQAEMPDCRFDLGLARREGRVRLSRCGVGKGSVEIAAPALEAFVLRKFREIKRAKIRIFAGWVEVEGFGEFVLVSTAFEVKARLLPATPTRLALADAEITFSGRPVDPLSRSTLLKALNPIVDLDRDLGLYGAIAVDKVELLTGKLRASGAVTIPVRPTDQGK